VRARKAAGLTQNAVAQRLRREDGRRVLAPWLNDLEHDRRYRPENAMIERLARILEIPADMLYFYAGRPPPQVDGILDDGAIEARTERMNSGNVRRRLDANGARDPRVEISADPEPAQFAPVVTDNSIRVTGRAESGTLPPDV
jgi:transcriptional regulator with XRE-family HTH domain